MTADLSWIYAGSILLTAALLWSEHRIVRPEDLSRVNVAFFTVNGWVGAALFLGMVLAVALLGQGAA